MRMTHPGSLRVVGAGGIQVRMGVELSGVRAQDTVVDW